MKDSLVTMEFDESYTDDVQYDVQIEPEVEVESEFAKIINWYGRYLGVITSKTLESANTQRILRVLFEVAKCTDDRPCRHLECTYCNIEFQKQMLERMISHDDFYEIGKIHHFLFKAAAQHKETLTRAIRKFRNRTTTRIAFGAYMVCANNDLRLVIFGGMTLQKMISRWAQVRNIEIAHASTYLEDIDSISRSIKAHTNAEWKRAIKRFFSIKLGRREVAERNSIAIRKSRKWVDQPFYLLGFDARASAKTQN